MHCLWKFIHLFDDEMDLGPHLKLALVLKNFSQKMGRFEKNMMKICTTSDEVVINPVNHFVSVVIFISDILWLYAQHTEILNHFGLPELSMTLKVTQTIQIPLKSNTSCQQVNSKLFTKLLKDGNL